MRTHTISSLVALVVLAGCGGGGGSGQITPATPSEVPTLETAVGEGRGFVAPAQRTVRSRSSVVTIERDQSLRIRVGGDTIRRYDAPQSTESNIETYSSADGSDFLIQNAIGLGFGDVFDLNHTVFGVWAESDVPDLLSSDRAEIRDGAAFYVAVPTPASQMPTTGAATYRGAILGIETDGAQLERVLFGPADLEADFLRGTMSGSALLAERGGPVWGAVSMPGIAISGTTFASDNVSATTGHNGTLSGIFSGPQAAEIAGTLLLEGDTTVRASLAARQR